MLTLKPIPNTVIADLPTIKCVMAVCESGDDSPIYSYPDSEAVYLFLEGCGEIVAMDGVQVEQFTAPMQAYIPAGTPYTLKNVGTDSLKFVSGVTPNSDSEEGVSSSPSEMEPVVMLGTENGERFPESGKIRGGMLTFPPNLECDYHSHDEADEVFLFLSGSGVVTEEGEAVHVGPGDVVVTLAERKHKIKSFDEPLVMWLTVTPNLVPSHTHYKQLEDGTWERLTPR